MAKDYKEEWEKIKIALSSKDNRISELKNKLSEKNIIILKLRDKLYNSSLNLNGVVDIKTNFFQGKVEIINETINFIKYKVKGSDRIFSVNKSEILSIIEEKIEND